ncbi:Hypp986 [Branchiostoma lanceolatum]|uniref:Hypp986 protein n=1 Tax=Branchiostoma lanceolatum TaxID=7740 RepID=A0A8J9ZE14_BRALA|nr:Hypp986 [Branchiostoma lanceolatum]
MAAGASKVFSAKNMILLLTQIDNNVRLIVHHTRKEGAKVRQEVGRLLEKYLDLLSRVLRGCKHLKNYTEFSRRSLNDIEKTLTLVLNGSVREFLEDIRMQHYLPNFERKDLRNVSQLLKDNFDIDQVVLPTEAAKETIQDKIGDLRNDLSTMQDRLQEIKKRGETCCTYSKKITQNFDTFLKEIKETQEATLRALQWHRFKQGAVCVAAIGTIGLSIALLATCTGGAAACACAYFGIADIVIPIGATEFLTGCGVVGGAAGYTGYRIYQKEKEMEELGKALKKLQQQLNEILLDASKQKTDWEQIDTTAESVMEHINASTVGGNADNLEPSRRGPLQRQLKGVQRVCEEVEDLQDNVVQFEKEAKRTLAKLRGLSLIKESDVVLTPPENQAKSSLELINDFTAGLATGSGRSVKVCTPNITASLTVE